MFQTISTSIRNFDKKSKIKYLLAVIVSIAINVFGWHFLYQISSRGIEFSDEGKYLLDSAMPHAGSYNVTHYGYVYSKLFSLLDFNIPLFRFTNLLITFVLASFTTFLSLRTFKVSSRPLVIESLLVSFALGLISLSFFLPYLLVTPSYNSLTFQSLMLCSVFMIRFLSTNNDSILNKYSFLLSGSFSLLFLAKPTSFVLLLSVFLIFISITRVKQLISILSFLILVFIFLCIFSLLIYGKVLELFFTVKNGFFLTLGLSDSYGLFSQFSLLKIPNPQNWILIAILFLIVTLVFQSRMRSRLLSRAAFTLTFLSLPFYVLNLNTINITVGNSYLLFCGIFFLYFIYRESGFRTVLQRPKVILLILILPFAGAFGTNNNLWSQSSMFFYFFLLYGIMLWFIDPNRKQFEPMPLAILVITVLLTIAFLSTSIDNPYRQISSLRNNTYLLNENNRVDGLRVSKETLLRLKAVFRELRQNDFREGTPVIDFTGQSPTTLFLAGAFPLGDTWLLGGYEGSNHYAFKKLSQVDCRILSEAWLLIEENGPRSLAYMEIIGKLGLNMNNYRPAAKWVTPRGAGGYNYGRSQILYKPMNQFLASCKTFIDASSQH